MFTPRNAKGLRRIPLQLEVLEDRTVPAIVINGTPGPDVITSAMFPIEGSTLYRAEVYLNGETVLSYTGKLFSNGFGVHLPEQLIVNGMEGNDQIDLFNLRDPEPTFPGQFLPTIIHGGPGDDVVTGTVGHDVIYGDAGADRLNGLADEDVLHGDEFDLSFNGGGGNNVLAFDSFSGTLRVTATRINMNGNILTGQNYLNIGALDVTGSENDDVFDFDQFPGYSVKVRALGGNDVIRTIAQSIQLDGGEGDDNIVSRGQYSSYYFDSIHGGPGNDRIIAASSLSIYGDEGDDFIDVRSAPFDVNSAGIYIFGGDGNDTIHGSNMMDYLYGDAGDDIIRAHGELDFLTGGEGADILIGGEGDGFFEVDEQDIRWVGGTGYDIVTFVESVSQANITNTRVFLANHTVRAIDMDFYVINGTSGDDTLLAGSFGGGVWFTGFEGNDRLSGGYGGNNLLYGGEGNDLLLGGPSNDELVGDEGDDILLGGDGPDFLFGAEGVDQLIGEAGDDFLAADISDSMLDGGSGVDFISFQSNHQTVLVTDTFFELDGVLIPAASLEGVSLYGTSGDDILDASTFSGSVEYWGSAGNDTITTGYGNDLIYGEDGDDFINTGAGDDTIYGGAGDDVINAGEGNDYLAGNSGIDTLIGGSGADMFLRDYDDIIAILEALLWDFNELEGDILFF
ncbi:MAG: hypothetical protein JNJ77_09255 [Planctomycetia bacterium]|nr:hypothetical protein [Planctomycetia bacterium]